MQDLDRNGAFGGRLNPFVDSPHAALTNFLPKVVSIVQNPSHQTGFERPKVNQSCTITDAIVDVIGVFSLADWADFHEMLP